MKTSHTKILFVSHDANRAGGQIFLLNVMQYFAKQGIKMHLLLLDRGVLENDFSKVCAYSLFPKKHTQPATLLKKALQKSGLINPEQKFEQELEQLKTKLAQQNFGLIYVNTIASAWVMKQLDFLNIPIISHIHELEFSLQMYASKTDRDYLFSKTTKFIACSQAVADNLIEKHAILPSKIETIHSFIDNENIQKRIQNTDNQSIKNKYSLPKNTFLVGGCGNAEWRKGLDIFILVARKALEKNPHLHFVWIGIPKEGELFEKMIYDIEKLDISKNITLIAPTAEAVELVNCLDVFTLVSREDPFPLVMLEAALAAKPIIGFEKTGGCREFVEEDAGFVVPYLDVDQMAEKINECARNENLRKSRGEIAYEKVMNKYNFQTSIQKIQDLLAQENWS